MLFNYLFDSNLLFYGIFIGIAGILGYSLYNYIWDSSESNSDLLFDDTETGYDPFYLEYVEQTTPKSILSGSEPYIQEFKFNKLNEIMGLYSKEMDQYAVTKNTLMTIIDSFPIPDLYSNNINETILSIMENVNQFGPYCYCLW